MKILPLRRKNIASMAGPPLDEIDHELLALLQEDASRTLLDLGRAVRLSPSAVQRRIRRYLASGLIARRAAVLDPRALDEVLLALVLVELKSGAAEVQAALRRRLLDAAEVQQCYDVAGRWDYVVVLTARDMPHCRELVAHLFRRRPRHRALRDAACLRRGEARARSPDPPVGSVRTAAVRQCQA